MGKYVQYWFLIQEALEFLIMLLLPLLVDRLYSCNLSSDGCLVYRKVSVSLKETMRGGNE